MKSKLDCDASLIKTPAVVQHVTNLQLATGYEFTKRFRHKTDGWMPGFQVLKKVLEL